MFGLLRLESAPSMFRDMWADLGLRAVGWSAARRGEGWLVFGGVVWCVLPAGRGSAVMQDMAGWLKNSFGDMGQDAQDVGKSLHGRS